jgi:F-type H+-transporting ATPase subunit delta
MNPAKLHDTVLDTGAEQLGKIYARALLAAAISAGSTDRVLAELNQLVDDLLRNNPQLATAFASPKITEDEKYRVIDRLFGPTCDPVLVRFLKVMAKRGRLGYLAAVRDAANDLQDEMMGRVVAEVRTAVPLAADLRQAVIERISHSAGKEVRLVEVVDAELVGGMVIRLGDTIFDGSVSNRINKLGRRVRAGFSRELVEKFATFAGTAD